MAILRKVFGLYSPGVLDIAVRVLDIAADVRSEVVSISVFFRSNLYRLNSLELSRVPPESRVVGQTTVPSLSPEMQDEQVSRIHPEYFFGDFHLNNP